MSDSAEDIERYYAIRKGDFGFVERIELAQDVNPTNRSGFQLTIILRARADSSSPILCLDFAGVQELRIGELDGLLRYMLEIRSIAEMQIEGSRYRITESEYDAFSFVCSTFGFKIESGI